ncbi:MAG: SprT family zinc-dependent metalloprotease [Nitrospinota bacterium]|nr:M48 family metallopeptidase [Nitrospinota bacterium]
MGKIAIDKIIRTKRRTFGLRVGSDATLTVRAPLRADIKLIEKIVAEKSAWIAKKQEEALRKGRDVVTYKFEAGELFHYLGQGYPLTIAEHRKTLTLEANHFILPQKYGHKGKEVFVKWYKEKALAYVGKRVDYYSHQMGLSYKSIRISSAKKRWGSCSGKGNLSFSWRLILAAPEIIDYVVIHELAHLKHHNHAKTFWLYVESILPNYKVSKKRLKDNGHLLSI